MFCARFECSCVGASARKMNRKGIVKNSEIYIFDVQVTVHRDIFL